MENPHQQKGTATFLDLLTSIINSSRTCQNVQKVNTSYWENSWVWTEEQTIAFEQLKAKVTMEPILHLAQDEGQFKMEVDGLALQWVLSLCKISRTNGKLWHITQRLSKRQNETMQSKIKNS